MEASGQWRVALAAGARALAGRLGGLGCSASEALALALLAAGAAAALGVLWLLAHPRDPGDAPAALSIDGAPPDAGAAVPAGPGAEPRPGGRPGLAGGGRAGPAGDGQVVVHVAGRVAAPGLYRLPAGARLADAVEAAGGALPDAVLDAVNLARPLADGEQVYVPGPDDAAAPPGAAEAGSAAQRPDGTIDLNRATAADLEALPGIGPVLAARIVDHRERVGGFTSVGQLRDVPGIGEKTFQSLAPMVSV